MKPTKKEYCSIGCLLCTKPLENFAQKGNHPLKGVEFVSYGHYGSAVFDPMDGTRLLINICDECLNRALLENRILHEFNW